MSRWFVVYDDGEDIVEHPTRAAAAEVAARYESEHHARVMSLEELDGTMDIPPAAATGGAR